MLAELRKTRFPVEIGLLLAYCVCLPLVEFWKNVALVGYFAAWIVNRVRAREFGGPWAAADTVVVLWIGGAYLSASFAGLPGHAWAKTGDVAAFTLLFWMVMRAGYAQRELRWVLGALVASALAGLAQGYWNLWSGAGKSRTLQLHSVGHVNHTAIYLAMMLGVAASWLFACWRAWSARVRAVGLAVCGVMLASLVTTASRGAIGVGALLLLVLAAAWWPRWKAPLKASALALIVLAALLAVSGAEVVQKQLRNVSDGNVLAYRDGVWRMGLAAWEKYPWFGVGKDNYDDITHEKVREWRLAAGKPYEAERYVRFPHGHSLYVNTLAERGAVGFATLLLVLLGALAALVARRPRPGESDFAWLLWGAAASAWLATVGIGTVNTTLHHEHGQLAALLLALWLSTQRARPASS